VPDSFGKRQREQVKGKKATAREERRLDRNQRRAKRASGADGDPGDFPEWLHREGVEDAGPDEDAAPDDGDEDR
jgi:hypothetical protein